MSISSNRLSPEYALLGFLYERPSHGYELHHQLREEFNHIWHTSQSQTYNILKRLEVQKYITSIPIEQEKLPQRLEMHITDAGRQRFLTWLNTPTRSSVHAIRVEFITRLYFFHMYYPLKIQELILVQMAEVRIAIKQLQATMESMPDSQIFNRLGQELRIRQLKSILGWLSECGKAFKHNP